jgi:hypothetical protein
VTFRIAKPGDAKALARVHYSCSADLADSFMCKLGERWLASYYRIVLNDPNSVVLCAVADNGAVVGFNSASLEISTEMAALRRHRIRLLWAALPALIRRPGLLRGMLQRQKNSHGEEGSRFIVASGPRGAFLGWLRGERNGGEAIALLQSAFGVMRALGSGPIRFEVDVDNERAFRLHRSLGATITERFTTPDGKDRVVMEYPGNAVR